MDSIVDELKLDEKMNEEISKFRSGEGSESNTLKAEEMIRTLNILTEQTKHELQGVFTFEEALLCVSTFLSAYYGPLKNGFLYGPREFIYQNIEDTPEYEKQAYGIDTDSKILIDKIRGLTVFQGYCLAQMCLEYLEEGTRTKEETEKIFNIK